MTEHSLKTFPGYFRAVADGRKPWTLRRNDRGFAVGDTLRLQEWDPDTGYTGRALTRRVAYVLDHGQVIPGLEPGYVVMTLEPLPSYRGPGPM